MTGTECTKFCSKWTNLYNASLFLSGKVIYYLTRKEAPTSQISKGNSSRASTNLPIWPYRKQWKNRIRNVDKIDTLRVFILYPFFLANTVSLECFCVEIESRGRFFPTKRVEPANELEKPVLFIKWRAIGAGERQAPWEELRWGRRREKDNLLKQIGKAILSLFSSYFLLTVYLYLFSNFSILS
jgi:hypothetical protein